MYVLMYILAHHLSSKSLLTQGQANLSAGPAGPAGAKSLVCRIHAGPLAGGDFSISPTTS